MQRIMHMLVWLCLLPALVGSPAWSRELTQEQVDTIGKSPWLNSALADIYFLFNRGDTAPLRKALALLPVREQEAAKLRLVEYAATLPSLTEPQQQWLTILTKEHPQFTVQQRGSDYVFSMQAFNYSMLARGVLLSHEQAQKRQQAIADFNEGRTTLAAWLKVSPERYFVRRDILIEHGDQLTDATIKRLVAEFGENYRRLLWLPDNAIIAYLAQRTDDPGLHALLWRRKTDAFSIDELERLAGRGLDDYATQQLMAATENPSLKLSAYQYLARLHPMPPVVESFLLVKLNEIEDGQLVANQLVAQGYRGWVSELVLSELSPIRMRHLQRALAATP
uniref:hypothetical protein n=1 Tax=Thaumasiovibrio occultus TaxID=1891184 RepID=UPI00131B2E9F|nr:hypothetical protein [Thaumasiovibrio occultus]